MGYSTQFMGTMEFMLELGASELAFLNKVLGEDWRDCEQLKPHVPENAQFFYIDLELTKDFNGVQWNNSEKTYDMTGQLNTLVKYMRTYGFSAFGFRGEIQAQGEDVGDIWKIVAQEDGYVKRVDVVFRGTIGICPDCGSKINLDDVTIVKEKE